MPVLISSPYFVVPLTPWDISAGSYTSKAKSVAAQETSTAGVAFKSDGTKMYVVGGVTNSVFQYTLSTPWDVSTATYDSVTKDLTSETGNPHDIFFKPDGTKMYIVESGFPANVYQYSLTAWDLSTASYDSIASSVYTQSNFPLGLFFKSDGSKLYVTGSASIYQYTVTTPWDMSAISYDGVSHSFAAEDGSLSSFFFKPDGTKVFILGNVNDTVFQYSLSSAWDLTTISYDSASVAVGNGETVPSGLAFKIDGTAFYVVGTTNNTVYQYTV